MWAELLCAFSHGPDGNTAQLVGWRIIEVALTGLSVLHPYRQKPGNFATMVGVLKQDVETA